MTTNNTSLLRAAQADDLDALCEMIATFNAEDGHALENPVRPVLEKLLSGFTAHKHPRKSTKFKKNQYF